jgi:dipeptidase E
MRLYLSSQDWGNQPDKLFNLIGESAKKVGIITNSTDLFPEEGTLLRVNRDVEYLKDKGFMAERLDLRNYFDKQNALRKKLNELGLVWIRGGNAFVLRRAMQQSGFDVVIKELLKKDQIVYGGFSAASCVAGATLRGIDIVDDVYSVPDGYQTDILWEGLGLVSFAVAPHYKSDHPESPGIDRTVEYFKDNNIPYKVLRDGEALMINGDKMELLS